MSTAHNGLDNITLLYTKAKKIYMDIFLIERHLAYSTNIYKIQYLLQKENTNKFDEQKMLSV